MRRVFFALGVLLLMLTPMMVLAQEPGGTIIAGNGGTSVGSLVDIRCTGTDCRYITQFLYPGMLGTDPETQFFAAGVPGAMATDYTVSEDGLVYTFTLDPNRTWSDGEQIDGWDYKFAYDAILSGQIESPYQGNIDGRMTSVEVSEDGLTVTVTFSDAQCDTLSLVSIPTFTPGHVYGWEAGVEDFDFSVMVDHPMDTEPNVTGGIFAFESQSAGERVALVPDENHPTPPQVDGLLYVNVPDQTVLAERFIAGELNVSEGVQNAKRQEIRDNESLQYFDFPGRTWDYVAFNLANPDNPQDGVELDADGNPVYDENGLPVIAEQEANELFSDQRVRRAFQHAINLDEIMEKAVLGEGTIMAANELPSSWALNPDLAPIPHDPEAAAALLDEAGWVLGDDGIRVCQGCGTAEDGTRFSFELLTNEGNTRRGQIGELVQDHLGALGIEVIFTAIDFNQLLEIMDAQTYDALILGWSNGYPIDPDQTTLFTSDGDVVGSGFNFVSYTNPEIDRLMLEAKTVPGCAVEDRAALYHQIQEILQNDQPYLWLFAQGGFYAANAAVEGFGPYPNEMYWNVETWSVAQ